MQYTTTKRASEVKIDGLTTIMDLETAALAKKTTQLQNNK